MSDEIFSVFEYQKKCRHDFIAGLRLMADWYEANPEMPATDLTVNLFAHTKDEFLSMRRAGGLKHKGECGDWLVFSKSFTNCLRLEVNIKKEKTCSRVKVGQRVVPAQPERPATPERVEDIYEWVCPQTLLGTADEWGQDGPVTERVR